MSSNVNENARLDVDKSLCYLQKKKEKKMWTKATKNISKVSFVSHVVAEIKIY